MIARSLGTPLTPMQQYVADVAGEERADGSLEYEVIVWTVPRQTGKTTGLRAIGTKRALVDRRQVFYTAQTGKDARERWSDLVKLLRVTPALKDRIDVKLRGGSEQVVFPGGGAFRCFAPTPESLHGYTPEDVFIDEAFAQSAASGELLQGAIGPAQFTLLRKQLWIVSTAGTAESTFLHDWIERGIEGTPRVAIFDWGARDDQDPFDLDDIAAFHPGVGQCFNGKVLTAADVLAEADRNSRAEYERAFANRRTVTTSHLIPTETWRDLANVQQRPRRGVTLTYDVAHDRAAASIVATWLDDLDHVQGRVVAAGPGVRWLPARIRELREQLRPLEVAAAGNGPVLEVIPHVPGTRVLPEREFAAASSAFLTRVDEATIHHPGPDDQGVDVLATGVAGLVTRTAGDGIAFSRRHSVGDTSAAIALVIGSWCVSSRRAGKPRTRHGKAAA